MATHTTVWAVDVTIFYLQHPTFVDIAWANMIDLYEQRYELKIRDTYPALARVANNVNELPQLQDYFKKRAEYESQKQGRTYA